MASILKVDELQGIATAGDITVTSEGGAATQSLQQGLAKAWSNYNQASAVVTGSFNVTSISDDSIGKHTVNVTNNMTDTTYAVATYARRDTDNDNAGAYLGSNSTDAKTTSAMKFKTNYLDGGTSANGLTDYSENGHHFMGDLA